MLKQIIDTLTVALTQKVLSSRTITLSEVRGWAEFFAQDDCAAGFADSALPRGPSQKFVEVTLSHKNNKAVVTATAYFNARAGAVGRKEWLGAGIDSALKKAFGNNYRIRMDL